jgi:5-methylthioadenosine/S-adenosylhomocysteine deaminase
MNSPSRTTLIRGGTIVAWQDGGHRILEDGVVVYRGDSIVHIGRAWSGVAEEVVEASGKLVCPGFISTHAHVSDHVGDRLVVDAGRRDFLRTGFLNYAPRRRPDGPGFSSSGNPEASLRYGFASLIRNGVTTVVQLDGGPGDGGKAITRIGAESGVRLYYGPYCNGGDYFFDRAGQLERHEDEAAGLAAVDRAGEAIASFDGSAEGRLRGIVVFDELFQATPRLLRRVKETAARLKVGITLHASEQVHEFHEILRRTMRTPIGWLEDEGFLGPEVILGHCIYVSGHRFTAYPFKGDLEAIAAAGASVAHSPVALARRGVTLDSFQRYREHGINLAIGTDSYPQDILAEMRWASLTCKVTERNNESASAAAVFEAATIGGAKALRRDDLGRLAIGAKADIVLIDLEALRFGPIHDPIRALVYCGTGELVDTVVVAGRKLMENKRLIAWDEACILAEMRKGAEQVWSSCANWHWSGQDIDEVFPPSLSPWEERLGSRERKNRLLG